LSQTQLYVNDSALQLFASVLSDGVICRQRSGQAVFCESHHVCLVDRGTELGSIDCAEATPAMARAKAVAMNECMLKVKEDD